MTNIKEQIDRLREAEGARAFLNRPSLRKAKEGQIELEAKLLLDECLNSQMKANLIAIKNAAR